MFRTTVVLSIIFLSLSNISRAEPYVGADIDIGLHSTLYRPSNVGASIFGGTGTKVGAKQNFYLGGELSLDYLSTYALGLSFIPGIMLTKDTMLYGRLGVDGSLSSYKNHPYFGSKLGIGVQTNLTKHWDFRTEYVSSSVQNNNQLNLGLLYKFD